MNFNKITARVGLTLGASMLAALATAGIVTAQSDTPGPDGSTSVTSVSPAQARSFAILRRAQRTGDVPAGKAPGLNGANFRLARAADTPAGKVYVVPARQQICLFHQTPEGWAGSCTADDQAAAGKLVMTLRDQSDKPIAEYGVLPDGAQAPAFVGGAPGRRPVLTNESVYGAHDTAADAVSYDDGNGASRSVELP